METNRNERPIVAVVSARGDRTPPGLEPLKGRADLRLADSTEALEKALPEAEVLLVIDFRTSLLQDAWPLARRLRWVHTTSAGIDHLLFPALVESDVTLTNARGVFDDAIAETVLGWLLLFAKDTFGTLRLQQERRWRHRNTERLAGTRALVVGAGSIGRSVARLLRAAGVAVSGTASRRRDDPDFDEVGGPEDLHRLLEGADWVVITAPLTDATRGLIGREELRRMKRTARLVNVGRGPIVRTGDLVDALRMGEIAGAALDVFEEEPLPPEHPLWSLPNVLVSAHMAGDFEGWEEALGAQFVDEFGRWKRGEPLRNVVEKRRGYGATGRKEGSR